MYGPNHLKNVLRSGNPAVGCWLHLCSPLAAEIVALTGFDMVIIDHEHGPGDFLNAVALMHAVSATPATPVMRVPWNDAVYIKRALDIGVGGIIVPSVDNAEQAKAAVAACRYPPAGMRGAAFTAVRASDYGLQAEQYLSDSPENVLVMCQVESRAAVANVEEIAAVDGVDLLFVGPLDLSASMGIIGQTDSPEFLELRTRTEKAIKAAGKWMGGLAVKGDSVTAMRDRGYDLITGCTDALLLRGAAVAHLETLGR